VLILLILRRHRWHRVDPGIRSEPFGLLIAGGVAVLVLLPVTSLQLRMGQIIWHWLEPGALQPTHAVLEALQNTAWGPWGAVQLSISAIVVAPIAEELLFRGLLLQSVWGYVGNVWLAVVLSGVVFGLIHGDVPQSVLPLATMGVVLGYVRVRYRSLTACILAHALFNARTMAFVLLNPEMARGSW
jgi:membrane protease YdiL (CAAX protease family)